MPLTLVGLGLGNEKDITLRGMECVSEAKYVFMESYTSELADSSTVQKLTKNPIKSLYRNDLEEYGDEVIKLAIENPVVLLVVGDPLRYFN